MDLSGPGIDVKLKEKKEKNRFHDINIFKKISKFCRIYTREKKFQEILISFQIFFLCEYKK